MPLTTALRIPWDKQARKERVELTRGGLVVRARG